MRQPTRDVAFSAFVTTHRARLLGAAVLMHSDPERAEEVVERTLARLYESWSRITDPELFVFGQVTLADPGPLALPWRRPDGIELIDAPASGPLPSGVLADLDALDVEQRRVVVLERFVGLSTPVIAQLLGSSGARVQVLSTQAMAHLGATDPSRHRDPGLTEQLNAALPPREVTWDVSAARDDLAHGRMLVRQRHLRVGVACTAILVLVALGISQLVGGSPQEPQAAASASFSTPPPAVARCNTKRLSCRVDVVDDWRSEMARVARSYVDPRGSYFSGYSYSSTSLYDTDSFWSGSGGVLGLDLFRLNAGGTEVYVQIATNAKFALHCGKLTGHTCISRRFMDGNRFTVADTTYVREGLEVQYSPRGDEVITVVARTKYKGHQLQISQAQLIALVQDERLRLPPV